MDLQIYANTTKIKGYLESAGIILFHYKKELGGFFLWFIDSGEDALKKESARCLWNPISNKGVESVQILKRGWGTVHCRLQFI